MERVLFVPERCRVVDPRGLKRLPRNHPGSTGPRDHKPVPSHSMRCSIVGPVTDLPSVCIAAYLFRLTEYDVHVDPFGDPPQVLRPRAMGRLGSTAIYPGRVEALMHEIAMPGECAGFLTHRVV